MDQLNFFKKTHDTFSKNTHLSMLLSSKRMKNAEDKNIAPVFLTKREAAKVLNISERTLCNWMARRLVSYVRIGRTIRFRRSDLEQNIGTFFASRSRGENAINNFVRS